MVGTRAEKRKDLILLSSFRSSTVINPSLLEKRRREAGSEEDAESKHEYADVDADVC